MTTPSPFLRKLFNLVDSFSNQRRVSLPTCLRRYLCFRRKETTPAAKSARLDLCSTTIHPSRAATQVPAPSKHTFRLKREEHPNLGATPQVSIFTLLALASLQVPFGRGPSSNLRYLCQSRCQDHLQRSPRISKTIFSKYTANHEALVVCSSNG